MKKWKYTLEYRVRLKGVVEADTQEEASELAKEQELDTNLNAHAELYDEFITEVKK